MLKMNQKYLCVVESWNRDCLEAQFYICNYKDKFEAYKEDWNCDGDKYTIVGQYLEREGEGYRDFISESDFNHSFFEYKPIKCNYILNIESLIAYNKYMELKYEGEKYVYLEGPHKNSQILEIQQFEKEYRIVSEVSHEKSKI